MVDDIIAKIMEEERVEQMDKMKKRNESVEMMRQVPRTCSCSAIDARVADCCPQFMEDRERWKAEEVRRQQAEDDAINKCRPSLSAFPVQTPQERALDCI